MTFSKLCVSALLSLAVLVPATGCSVSTDPEPTPVVVANPPGGSTTTVYDGTLIVDWTINGTKDPSQCQQGNAPTIDIVVSGSGGGEFQQDCGAFATSITLPPGNYSASAVLLDEQGSDRTTVVDMDPFVIRGSDQLTIPIDFPADSFR